MARQLMPHVVIPEEVNVSVIVRVRPPTEREKQLGYQKCVTVDPLGHSVTLFQPTQVSASAMSKPLSPPPQHTPRTFRFDYVADEFVTQEEMFTSVGKPMAHACLQGYHCCLIAYGQTGAGKTYTMEGPNIDSQVSELDDSTNSDVMEKNGLIPRIMETIFFILAAEKDQSGVNVEFSVRCSSLQIYNEQVEDLLCPESTNLTIHEDAKTGMYVEGLQEVEVQTPEAMYEVMKRGSINRHVGATAMNSESSRSHGVFILIVESQRQSLGVVNRRLSQFYLVDLAGSERQKQTEAVGLRLKESGSINKSLSALGNVIKALLETAEGKIRHIPYRDSKLTYLLKDALGGNSKCILIANISPSAINIDETLSTLKFAQRVKYMRNVAIVNENMLSSGNVFGEEIKRLRFEVASLRAKIGNTSMGDQSIAWNDHSANSQIKRLEYIIAQSAKQALAGERKTAQDMHALARKLDALKSLYLRLDRTLQNFSTSVQQKQRIDSYSPSVQVGGALENDIVSIPDQKLSSKSNTTAPGMIKKPRKMSSSSRNHHHSIDVADTVVNELDAAEERDQGKNQDLKSQIAHLKSLNQSLKAELSNLSKEKKVMATEFSEMQRDCDQSKKKVISLEGQVAKLEEALAKLRQDGGKEVRYIEAKSKYLWDFQRWVF